jgi:hypothetical protein
LDVTVINYKVPWQAQPGHGSQAMLSPGDRKIELEKLKARRKQLFELFVEHPSDIRISLEIKRIDDQIAKLAERKEPRQGTE